MSKNKQKKIHNRFDEYQICHTFTESTQQFLENQHKPIQTKFILRCVLGTLLAVNAYLSHWGPWKWPNNYYPILFSVFFYYIVSTYYMKLVPVDNSKGNSIGEYEFKGKKRIFIMTIEDSKRSYTLDIMDSNTKKSLAKKSFLYLEYFTEKGLFLQSLYHKHLGAFLQNFDK